ncbi:LacI family DNA-binding transcriptional regulator [uncultured Victivallis sp.]|uniref:LacI family DNA-binding transcriptional regulator n=1 Tax=uncultured Victivallis sp. TaxID=354118 RepID=UPI0025958212|nr:LacI family DNA-binding transcriptional regulator [uncultured Victivallis sp.]
MNATKDKPRNMTDIAEMLGITAQSVSLALRNSPLISQELRDQVQAIAAKTDFKARNYRRRRSGGGNSGKIMVLYEAANVGDPVAQQIMNSVMKRLAEQKMIFETCSCEELYDNPALIEGFAGVIYHYCFRPWFASILEGIAQVAIMHEEIDLGPWDSFKPNETLAGKLAANYLIGQGFQKAVLVWEARMAYRPESHPRLEGVRRRLAEAGVEFAQLSYSNDLDDPQAFPAALREALERFGNRAGIFAFNDQVAYKVCHTLDFAGLQRRPKELEVISCDNTYLLNELHPPLPAVDLHIAEIASRAVDGLLWRLSNPEASYQDVLIKPELILPKKK